MYKLVIFIFIGTVSLLCGQQLYAQQAIIELESDDTLPIASTRYDDAVEPPKDNFSSVNKNDTWERFERGELDQKAFIRLQEQYQAQANNSKDPYVQKKNQQRKIASLKKAKQKKLSKKSKGKLSAKLDQKNLKKNPKKKEKTAKNKKSVEKRIPASVKKSKRH